MVKKYLIIGANGFVGSYLVDQFAKEKSAQVRAFDRFSRDPQFKLADNVEVFKGSISLDSDILNALDGVDYVMHCFSATTPFISDQNPYIDITENLIRSVKIFELCVAAGVQKIGFISSGGAVYGALAEHKVAHEDDSPLPLSPYGINKLGIEHYLEYFKRKFGVEYSVYRLTNPYGPRQVAKKNQGVIPTFINHISRGEEIIIYGDGYSSRDYIYIEDAASMIADSFEHKNEYSIYNIGSGIQTSLNDIVQSIEKITGRKAIVSHNEAPATFPEKTSVSVERFTEEFSLRSKTTLEEGIRKMLDSGL